MAEQQDFQERTERATPKRLREAREKGQVPRSRELNTMMVMLAGSTAIFLLSGHLAGRAAGLMRSGLELPRTVLLDTPGIVRVLGDAVMTAVLALGPFVLICLAAALIAPMLLGGWNFSAKALAFKAEKLDPIQGFKRLFSLRNLIELAKAMAKFLLVGAAAVLLLAWLAEEFLGLGREPVLPALAHAMRLCFQALIALSAVLVLIAAVDVPFQLWDHARRLRMTRQEVREEHKETEGRPEVKARIRSLQQQLAQRRMMEEVPKADVVVTNPRHYAVALRYDERRMNAPRVVAKGADLVAARIRELALANEVPVFEAPPLARALYASAEIDQEIPVDLYLAVAQVLTYVYALKRASVEGLPPPERPALELEEHDR